MTAFYMTRLMALTFWGSSRVDKTVKVHESPLVMTIPLMVLAALSLNWWVDWNSPYYGRKSFPILLEGWLHHSVTAVEGGGTAFAEWMTMTASVGLAAMAAYLAYYLYVVKPGATKIWAEKSKGLHKLSIINISSMRFTMGLS